MRGRYLLYPNIHDSPSTPRAERSHRKAKQKQIPRKKLIKPSCTIEIRIANAFVGIGQFGKEDEQSRWTELC
jgi:hypothetical protein